MKTIYIIRHGQTDNNLNKIIQGRGIDASINETGLIQAQLFYHKYKHINFDKVLVSTQKRSFETVESFISENEIPFKKLAALDEISWGVMEGTHFNDNTEYYKELQDQWKNGNLNVKIPEGESPLDVLNRQLPAWNEHIINSKDTSILICMHGRALRILLCGITNQSLSEMTAFPHHNTGLYVINIDDLGNLKITQTNNIEHLKEM